MMQRLGWTLVHFLWQGTAIAAAYAIVRGFAGRSLSSRGRYLLACLALAVMALTPALTFLLLPRDGPDSVPLISWNLSTSAWQRVLPAVVAFWVAGVLVFSLRLFAGWRFTTRLRFASHPAPAEWQRRLEEIAMKVRASRPVCLLVSSMVEVPTVIGWLRPAILLPVGALTGLPPEHIEALLAHEIAHIRRHDYLASVLQSIVESVLFYHPAVWWISEQIRTERESCCDDLAVAVSGDVVTYVRALAGLESLQAPRLKPALAANGGSLVQRIRRLVDPCEVRSENVPGPVAAWAMMLLWIAGIGVASVHAAQTGVTTPRIAIPEAAVERSNVVSVPVPSPLPSSLPRRALMFDPFLSAQVVQLPDRVSTSAGVGNQWLDGDVAYIIGDEERRAFLALSTDDERTAFIEQFWLRRDPTPGTPENEFKEEHYRRIAYANQNFGTGEPGWKGDRGRVYIVLGPPDEIEQYQKWTAVRPSATTWTYRNIAGGSSSERTIGFADTAGTGEFRIAPNRPEVLGLLAQAISKPPAAGATVATNSLPMKVRWDYLRATSSSTLINITIQFEGKDLQFQPVNGDGKAIVNIFGRLSSMTRRPITTFEPTLELSAKDQRRMQYQQSIPLPPGRYHLNMVAKDTASGNVNNYEVALDVPHFDEIKLTASSLILADSMEKFPAKTVGSMFAIGDTKVRPRVGGVFQSGEKMGVYLQAYNFAVDEKAQKPTGSVEYEIDRARSGEKLVDVSEDAGALPNASASQITIQKLLPLTTLGPGSYTLKVTVTDRLGNQSVQRLENFTVSAE